MKQTHILVMVSIASTLCHCGTAPKSAAVPAFTDSTNPTPGTGTPDSPASASPLAALTETSYRIQSFVPDFTLDLADGNVSDGTPALQYLYEDGINQQWSIVPTDSTMRTFFLQTVVASGKCLGISDDSLEALSPVVVQTCVTNKPTQHWTGAIANTSGGINFINDASKLCMAVQSSSTSNDVPVVLQECANNASAVWYPIDKTLRSGYANVSYNVAPSNTFTRVSADLVVPANPNMRGTFGVEIAFSPSSLSTTLGTLGRGYNGVVLSYGPDCTSNGNNYANWSISAQYFGNSTTQDPNYQGCTSGPLLAADANDTVALDMQLMGTVWQITLQNQRTNQLVTFDRDLQGEDQENFGIWLQEDNAVPASPIVLNNVQMAIHSPDTTFCKPDSIGVNDSAPPVLSPSGANCTLSQIVLRPQGF